MESELREIITKAALQHHEAFVRWFWNAHEDKYPDRSGGLVIVFKAAVKARWPMESLLALQAEFGSDVWRSIEFDRFIPYGSHKILERAAENFYRRSSRDLLYGCSYGSISITDLSDEALPGAVAFLQWIRRQTRFSLLLRVSSLPIAKAIATGHLDLLKFLDSRGVMSIDSISEFRVLKCVCSLAPRATSDLSSAALDFFLSRYGAKERLLAEFKRAVSRDPEDPGLRGLIQTLRERNWEHPVLDELEQALDAGRKAKRFRFDHIALHDDPDRFEAALAVHQADGTRFPWKVSKLVANGSWRILKRVKERNLADLSAPERWNGFPFDWRQPEQALSLLRRCLLCYCIYPPFDAISQLFSRLSSQPDKLLRYHAYRLIEHCAQELGYHEGSHSALKKLLQLSWL